MLQQAKHVPQYFLYPVHVSRTFLLHRSLASALYLLVLRLLARNYRAAFALANAIATDKSYTNGERCIFTYTAEALFDQHPDAVACRLKITHSVSAVPKVKELLPWDTTNCMATLVLNLQSISAATRMANRELLQLLKLCCTSNTDDEFSAAKGHTEYKCALVNNFEALLSSEAGEQIDLQLPTASKGSGWPYENNQLVYALDKHSPSGSNIETLRTPGDLSNLLAKETGELLVLLVHEQPFGKVSDAVQKRMVEMSTDRLYRTVIFRFLSHAVLEQDTEIKQKLAVRSTPCVIAYKLDEEEIAIDDSLVGTKIKACKQPLGFKKFKESKQYDAEVVAVNSDGTLHLRYDDEDIEDLNAPVSLTDFGRTVADKTDQLTADSHQSPDAFVASFSKFVERLMDEPEDETWREELIVGDQVDAAIDASLRCARGHPLKAFNGAHHSCNVCHKNFRMLCQVGMRGTSWRCSAACDFDVCDKCYDKMIGTTMHWYRGVVIKCSGENITVHYELLSSELNAEVPWTSKKLNQRGKAPQYHYRKLKPNPEEETDESVLALRGFKMSGLTEEQLQERQAKWNYRQDQDEQVAAIDEVLAERLERSYQRCTRLGLPEFKYTANGKEFQVDLSTMRETDLGSGSARKLVRTDSDKKDADPTELLLEEYARLVEQGQLGEGQEACTLVVSDLAASESLGKPIEEYCKALSMMKKRTDALVPDDGWTASMLKSWCETNVFDVPADVDVSEAGLLLDAIQAYLSSDAPGPLSGFDQCVEWKKPDASSCYFIQYPTTAAANRARSFIQDQPSVASKLQEFIFEKVEDPNMPSFGAIYTQLYEAADTRSKAKFYMLGRGAGGSRIVASNIHPDKSGTDAVFIEANDITDQRAGGSTIATAYFLMNGPTGSFKPHNATNKWASAEYLSAIKMKSGTTWALISKHWKNLTLSYTPTRKQTGHAVLESLQHMWSGKEDTKGAHRKQGFLYLYSLFTGKTKVSVCDQDNGQTLATLYTRMLVDADERAMLPSILNQLSRNPALCKRLSTAAVFSDKRKKRDEKVSSEPVGDEPSPLAQLFVDLIPQIVEAYAVSKPDAAERHRLALPTTSCSVPSALPRSWTVATLHDYSCAKRTLNVISSSQVSDLSVDTQACTMFRERPLQSILADDPSGSLVSTMTRQDLCVDELDGALPFDVSRHQQARSEIAQTMLRRMEEDANEYAASVNTAAIESLACLSPNSATVIATGVEGDDGAARLQLIQTATTALEKVKSKLKSVRAQDQRYIDLATPAVLEMGSEVSLPQEDAVVDDEVSAPERYRYVLRRESGQEPQLTFEFVVGSLLSSQAVKDLQLVNPYLPEESIGHMLDIVVAAILSANRVGQINRCLDDLEALVSLLREAKELRGASTDVSLLAALNQKSQSLASQLRSKRHYIQEEDNSYDPRFLVFEYVGESQIMLRKTQVEMVRKFVSGGSVVKQMIMGAGKTTVIAPLLALMLGDGNSLVMSVVPKALLEMSRNVMRSTFSSIVQKRVFTLVFDRGSEVPPTLVEKLETARRESGVVIATPTTLKSIQLKFLELLSQISDVNRPRVPEMVDNVEMLVKVLGLFKQGVLLMDEVDVILHPLKSELNFPVGEKYDLDANPWRWELPMFIIECIFFARGNVAVDVSEGAKTRAALDALLVTIEEGVSIRALQKTPHIILLNPDWYHETMKPAVADWVMIWLEKQSVGKSGLSSETIKSYILGGANVENARSDEERHRLQAVHAAVSADSVSDTQRKMLNLSHDWLQHFFPHCLQKIDRVTFGILNKADYERIAKVDPNMPDTRRYLAIPFEGKDVPSKSSEFAHPDVTIGLSILAYRYEGLRYTDFDQIMNSLRATLAKEVGPYSQRKSSLLYQSWVAQAGGVVQTRALAEDSDTVIPGIWQHQHQQGDPEWEDLSPEEREEWMGKALVVPLRLLKRSNSGQMSKLFNLLRFEPKVVLWYLQEIIFPTHMRHQHTKLSASGQDLGGDIMFPKRIGFSGTPSDLLPMELGKCDYERGSDGKMVSIMTDKAVCSVEHLQPLWSAHSILDRIARDPAEKKALIDTGALITGLSNEEVARYLIDDADKLPWCAIDL